MQVCAPAVISEYLGRVVGFYFGPFCENYRSNTNYWATLFHSARFVLILTNHVLGYILGDFFTNSSGHPGNCIKSVIFGNELKNRLI
jgi:hypothetical protein